MRLFSLTIALCALLCCGAHAAKDSCFDCHSVMEGTSAVFKDDVHYHNAVSCADCHGGDASVDDQNLSMSAARGFKVRVTRQQTPEYCGRCHSDAAYMHKFNAEARVDQLPLYQTSVHAKELAAGRRAAECVDCHSVHNIRAVSDPLSPAQPQHLADVCAKCHAATAGQFRQSPHGRGFNTPRRPACAACHASHATQPAGDALLTDRSNGCPRCHSATSSGGKAAAEIARYLDSLAAAGPESSAALARARQAVHTLSVAAIKKAAETAQPGGETGDK